MSNAGLRFGARTLVRGATLAAALLAAVASSASAAEERNTNTVYPGVAESTGDRSGLMARARSAGEIRVIVGLRTAIAHESTLSAAGIAEQRRRLRSLQDAVAARVFGSSTAARVDRYDFIPFMTMVVDAGQLARLLADPAVASVQEDMPNEPFLTQSLPLIHATNLFAKGINGTGRTVAILDTGVSKTHPMFAGKIVSEACYSSNIPAQKVTTVCPGGATATTAVGSGRNCSTAIAGCDHGTHVAGIAAGNASIDGVARDSKIIAVQVFSKKDKSTCNPNTKACVGAWDSDIIKGLQRVHALRTRFKIAAVNMSLGGGKHAAACDAANPAMKAAIDTLRASGIATIVASGNNAYLGFISYPACISSAIAVGNTTKKDLVATSSNHSPLIRLLAPGTSIKSAIPGGTYALKTGTSMAAPHVTGAFALLKNAVPTAKLDDVLTALTCSGKVVNWGLNGANPLIELDAKPRIDLLGAYNWLKKPPGVVRTWSFTTAAQALDWTPFRGTWAVISGRYRQTPIQVGWIGSSVAACNRALDVTATMTRVDPANGSYSNTGIVLKSGLAYPTDTVSGYWFAYNKCPTDKDGFCTGDAEDKPGQAVLWRVDGYSFATNSGGAALLCQKFAPVNVDGLNRIRVVSNGSSHTFYLNGKRVCSVNDATYAKGAAMVAAYIADAGGHTYQVDSFSVKALTEPAAPADLIEPASMAPRRIPAGAAPGAVTPN